MVRELRDNFWETDLNKIERQCLRGLNVAEFPVCLGPIPSVDCLLRPASLEKSEDAYSRRKFLWVRHEDNASEVKYIFS